MSSLADQPASDAGRDPTIAARVEQLYESHAALVRSVCRSLLRDRVEAEDAVQQTFLSAQRALLNGSSPQDATAWLATIARHESLARVRGRMREPLPMEVEEQQAAPDAHAAAVGRHDAGALRDALAELPVQQREAILLREVRGFSYQEVAASLSVTTSAVESLLFRARRRLQTRLQGSLAALSLGEWVQPSRDLVARLVGGGVAAPAAAKVAVVGLGTAVVAGGAVVGPMTLGPGHAPRTVVTRVAHPPAQRTFQAATSKAPVTSPAPASHPAGVGVDSAPRHEVSDVKRTVGTHERERSSETTSRTSLEDRSSTSGSPRETSDNGGATQSTFGVGDGAQTSTSGDSRTATSDSTSSDSWSGTATTSPGTATTSPGTPDD